MFNFRILCSLLVLLCCCACGSTQQSQSDASYVKVPSSAKKFYNSGLTAKRNLQFQQSVTSFNKAISIFPNYPEARAQRAGSYIELGENARAIEDLKFVLDQYPEYNPGLHYTLAKTCLSAGDFTCTESSSAAFIARHNKDHRLYAKAQEMLRKARAAQEIPVISEDINIQVLPATINTAYSEYFPSFTLDGNQMVFTRKGNRQEDFFISYRDGAIWQKAKYVKEINTDFNEGAQSVAGDGRFMIYTSCHRPDGMGGCDLYYSQRIDNGWSRPKNCGTAINSAFWDSQPSVSADGRSFYFASDRPGGQGGEDLYVVHRLADGRWTSPENLGPTVNTQGDDFAPHIHADNSTLYFSSTGHDGLGQGDLFITRLQEDSTWSTPLNLGHPINTPAEEGGFAVSPDGETAYFSRLVRSEGHSHLDLFSFRLPAHLRPIPTTYFKAIVTDNSGARITAAVSLINHETGLSILTAKTNNNGELLIPLRTERSYELQITTTEHLFYSEYIALDTVYDQLQPYTREITLETIQRTDDTISENRVLTLNNIFWASGSATLLASSKRELNILLDILQKYPDQQIIIQGHTDNVGSEEDNLKLSMDRAQAVLSYLKEGGISDHRMSTKGYGESAPVADNDTVAGRQSNRRVEILFF